jgi:hypothetical protein
LGNPPFENFRPGEKAEYAREGIQLHYANKTAQALARALPSLRPGSVFGVVVPQTFLDSPNARDLRRDLVRDFELCDIGLFPDKLFRHGEAESAILLGRRSRKLNPNQVSVRYRQVREADLDLFRRSYHATVLRQVPQARFSDDPEAVLRVPELEDVWRSLASCRRLASLVEVGQGFQHEGRNLPAGAVTASQHRGSGFKQGFVGWHQDLKTHELPRRMWLNLSPSVIRCRGSGCEVGTPQVLLNYARVSRGPWRLKALLDRKGHAVTSRFLTVRPRRQDTPLEYLWGLLNSPLANAYVATHTGKRDILVRMMRALPIPRADSEEMETVAQTTRAYLRHVTAAGEPFAATTSENRAKELYLRMDAAVLRLYDLPPRVEKELLDYFAGHKRQGVPFQMDRYYPSDFTACIPLAEYLSEEFQRSTVGELRRRMSESPPSPELIAALETAAEAYRDDE